MQPTTGTMDKGDAMSAQAPTSAQIESGQTEPTMDEGLLAWLQVLGSWILFANTWWVLGWLEPHDGVSHDLRTIQSMWTIPERYLTMRLGV